MLHFLAVAHKYRFLCPQQACEIGLVLMEYVHSVIVAILETKIMGWAWILRSHKLDFRPWADLPFFL